MARGDQRERDRAKKQARLQKEAKGGAKVRASVGVRWVAELQCNVCGMRELLQQPRSNCPAPIYTVES